MPRTPNNKTVASSAMRGSSRIGSVLSLMLLLVILAGLIVAAFNRQNIYDWYRLQGYKAQPAIAALATQDSMTAYARKIFYVNNPQIDSPSVFNTNCPNNGGEQTIVLGCYHSDQRGIYLLSVNDPVLNGVEQVTAAHETLHAAYDRLSNAERNQVDAWLMAYYQNGLTDPRIKSTIDAYRKTEPTQLVNEMHSIFGTEVGNLPPQLEHYYTRYFSDRTKIVAYADNYQSAFTTRQTAAATYQSQLAALKTQIDSLNAALPDKLTAINSSRSQLNQYQASNNIAAYNAAVPGYNSLVNDYNGSVTQLKSLIAQYNVIVNKYNAIVLEEDYLNSELTSTTPSVTNPQQH